MSEASCVADRALDHAATSSAPIAGVMCTRWAAATFAAMGMGWLGRAGVVMLNDCLARRGGGRRDGRRGRVGQVPGPLGQRRKVLEPLAGGPLMALTARHCAAVLDQVYREVHGAHTTILGSVSAQAPDLDAEVFSLEAPSGWAQQVERGGNPPKTAVGWVPTRDQHKGDRVCFAGRTTGADQCGKIVKRYSLVSKTQICTDIDGDQGDSGGPAIPRLTAPRRAPSASWPSSSGEAVGQAPQRVLRAHRVDPERLPGELRLNDSRPSEAIRAAT